MSLLETHQKQPQWLSLLPAPLAQAFLAQAREQRFRHGEHIYQMGDPPGSVFGVASGVIAIQTDDSETGIVIGHLFGRGNWFGENAVLHGMPRQVGAVVKSEEATVLSVSLPAIEKLGKANPTMWRALAGLSALNASIAVQTATNLMIRDPEERCTAVLSRLQSTLPQNTPIPVSQEELATMCALSRGSISRVLKRLERRNRVSLGYGTVTLNPEAS